MTPPASAGALEEGPDTREATAHCPLPTAHCRYYLYTATPGIDCLSFSTACGVTLVPIR